MDLRVQEAESLPCLSASEYLPMETLSYEGGSKKKKKFSMYESEGEKPSQWEKKSWIAPLMSILKFTFKLTFKFKLIKIQKIFNSEIQKSESSYFNPSQIKKTTKNKNPNRQEKEEEIEKISRKKKFTFAMTE